MAVAVVVIEISHEEIHYDFLLYQAGNHSTPFVKPDFEEVKTFTIYPHISDEAFASRKQPVFIIPVFDYRLINFPKTPDSTTVTNDFPSRSGLSCFASTTLETCLASSMRKPPTVFMAKAHAVRGLFIIYLF